MTSLYTDKSFGVSQFKLSDGIQDGTDPKLSWEEEQSRGYVGG